MERLNNYYNELDIASTTTSTLIQNMVNIPPSDDNVFDGSLYVDVHFVHY